MDTFRIFGVAFGFGFATGLGLGLALVFTLALALGLTFEDVDSLDVVFAGKY